MTAFEPAIDGIRQLEGFVEGFFLVERDGLNAMTVTLWESFDAMERSRIAASRVRSEAADRGGSHGDGLVRVRGRAAHGHRAEQLRSAHRA